jgi:adenosylcobinamide-phosphate synthase
VAIALLVDAFTGEPAWLYWRLPHPVVVIGMAVRWLEGWMLRSGASASALQKRGTLLAAGLVLVALAAGAVLQGLLLAVPLGQLLVAVAASTLIAQRSLVGHVTAVARGLEQGREQGRAAVARIVGRDPQRLDAAAVGRAAVESLAENLSDGVVAPAFWLLVAGLPGLLAYKTANTLDSMVGHLNDRYRDFGWASARLDDLLNLIPARGTAGLLLLARHGWNRRGLTHDWRCVARDAPRHRSPNAGWPEAAMAYALGLRLGGPRAYAGTVIEGAWLGDGSPDVPPAAIDAALRLAWRAWAILFGLMLLVAVV